MRSFLLLIICSLLLLASCKKDPILTDTSGKLAFSTDTVIFDTVFTAVGSVTKRLKVYNPNSRAVNISTIHLAGGKSSNYRLNIDGVPVETEKDLQLRGGDSLFIFVEVTIDPSDISNPLVVTDSIVFETNGNLQDIDLVAWGQNFYYFPPGTEIGKDGFMVVYPNDKPWVFYGYSFVDTGAIWMIEAGTRMHFHKYSGLAVMERASLIVQGAIDKPVTMEGDRLEASYRDVPNQWGHPFFGGIYLTATSRANIMENVVIKNGNIGLQVDSVGDPANPQLKMHNVIIQNMSGVGLLAQGAHIEASNSVFANCGIHTAALVIGGKYNFTHCTFANYWRFNSRDQGMLLLNDYYEDINGSIIVRELEQARFDNCIIYGSREEEIVLNQEGSSFNYVFNHCVLKTSLGTTDASHFSNIIKNPGQVMVDGMEHDPVFNNPSMNDYSLFSKSVALDAGDAGLTGAINEDIEGNTRIIGPAPDLGAYEFNE